mmetsp:Transcript_4758/g.17849  ORF Transcript_4758/g.17849 Transcript_4758/m.17849 type:complete len:690 (-) Transcript_4758:62-2131(-)
MIQNFRRHARSSGATQKLSTSSPAFGADMREEVYETLPLIQQRLVDKEVFNKKSSIDNYLCFQILPANPSSHRIAIETDTAARCFVVSVIPLKTAGPSCPLTLPYYVVPQFVQHYPNFQGSLLSRVRYLNYASDFDRSTHRAGPNNKVTSDLDLFETYVQLLHGTMDKFWSDPTDEHAHNIWRVARTLQFMVASIKEKEGVSDIADDVQRNYDRVLKLIEKRDTSSIDAQKYREGVHNMPLFSYYYILYQAMLLDCKVMHKSNFVQSDLMLGGLFLMNMLNKDEAVTYEGIEDSFLRILYERAVHCFQKKSFAEFVDKDSLIRFLHEECASRFHGFLKFNAFFVEVYRRIFTQQPFYKSEIGDTDSDTFSMRQMALSLKQIRRYVKGLNGINVISHFISPTSTSYLTDENIAEYIINSCEMAKSDRKYSVLSTAMFTSSTNNSSILLECLERNLRAVQKAQDDLQEAAERIQIYTTAQNSDELPRFMKIFSQSLAKHTASLEEALRFKNELIAFVQSDNEKAPYILDRLLLDIHNTKMKPLGVKKVIRTVQHFSKEGGHIHQWLVEAHNHKSKGGLPFTRKDLKHNQHVFGMSKEQVSTQLDDVLEDRESMNIQQEVCTFEKFESALERHMATVKEYQEFLTHVIQDECPICFEEKNLVALHGDKRHSICTPCHEKLRQRVCPMCREPL